MIVKGRPTSENESLITPNGQASVQQRIPSSIQKRVQKFLLLWETDKIFLPIPTRGRPTSENESLITPNGQPSV